MTYNFPDKFFVLLFFIMNFLGVIGYYCGLDFYVRPSENALFLIFISCVSFFAAWFLFGFCGNRAIGNSINIESRRYDVSSLGALFSFILVFTYILIFRDSFPLYALIDGGLIGESARPDVVGNVPYYWTFTVVLSSFCIPFAVALTIKSILIGGNFRVFLYSLLLIFFATILGDKSTLLSVVFFFLFIFGRFSISRLMIFVFLFVTFYVAVKYLYYASEREFGDFLDWSMLFESIIRRVSFINVSSMGVFLDEIAFKGIGVPEQFNNVKQFVFYSIYGYLPGGAPIPYIVKAAEFLAVPLVPVFVFVVSFFIFYFRHMVQRYAKSSVYFVVLYLNFYGAIVLVSGGLSDYFFRSFLPICIVLFSSKVFLFRYGVGFKLCRY
ncbi:hypothetical protein [Stutzerimonas stutzeri]|uniref:hypothetical protein n=1 Tax=Stutzerimonas stutzeri TaxID=316 RepID=UPI002659AD05|nr:hypothetical protein [Stutzerimonas stutzeri]MCF6781780.1 hypothetical protein [Stutzerimonas stutzeri]MCF6804449.1 hypothetical protein [Stutzerimonas stutzeri]